jgi:hypothetical protein
VPDHVIEVAVMLVNKLPPQVQQTIKDLSLTAMPVQLHSVWLALFASVIAPFGEQRVACGILLAAALLDSNNCLLSGRNIAFSYQAHVHFSSRYHDLCSVKLKLKKKRGPACRCLVSCIKLLLLLWVVNLALTHHVHIHVHWPQVASVRVGSSVQSR